MANTVMPYPKILPLFIKREKGVYDLNPMLAPMGTISWLAITEKIKGKPIELVVTSDSFTFYSNGIELDLEKFPKLKEKAPDYTGVDISQLQSWIDTRIKKVTLYGTLMDNKYYKVPLFLIFWHDLLANGHFVDLFSLSLMSKGFKMRLVPQRGTFHTLSFVKDTLLTSSFPKTLIKNSNVKAYGFVIRPPYEVWYLGIKEPVRLIGEVKPNAKAFNLIGDYVRTI